MKGVRLVVLMISIKTPNDLVIPNKDSLYYSTRIPRFHRSALLQNAKKRFSLRFNEVKTIYVHIFTVNFGSTSFKFFMFAWNFTVNFETPEWHAIKLACSLRKKNSYIH
ncbi:hypothetical protein GCK32_003779 [Trichostrongylus colubriformis]|uniref:Uncharacterized protein n=1 Tax=Trichostrongylus colubriformis TaxID=6319 RepID=A0AAN8GBQ9_TRICO